MARSDIEMSVSIPAMSVQGRTERALIAAGVTCFVAALALAGIQLYAFEAAVAGVAMLLSTDGVVEASNRRALSAAFVLAAGLAAIVGALLLLLSSRARRAATDAALTWDAFRSLGLAVPGAYSLLVSSATIGALIIVMHLVGSRLGEPVGPLFRKEGPFELLTAVLALAGAFWSAVAAFRWRTHARGLMRGAPLLYAGLAAVLFFVGMEELNWGQTVLEFETPAGWAAINYQQQTSVHNLIDAPALELAERAFVVVFGLSVLALIGLARRWPRSVFAAIAPPVALVPLAALCAIPGFYLRLEITELLLTLFFAFYGYRLYVAARSLR